MEQIVQYRSPLSRLLDVAGYVPVLGLPVILAETIVYYTRRHHPQHNKRFMN